MDLTLNQYQTRLPSFEGPLDLLLHLIERQKLDISDVSLVVVTDQFLDHIASLDDRAPHIIAEFTSVGTRLTVLKSRWLLPRPPVVDEEITPDPDDLVEQLKAYQRLKAAARTLGDRLEAGAAAYAPSGTGPVIRTRSTADTRLATYEAHVLLRAVRRRLSAVPKTVQAIRARKIVSIREMTDRVLDAISRLTRVSFSQVTADATSRTERATAFLAVLVLVRRGMMNADQHGLFDEINLTRGELNDPEMLQDMETDFVN
jgi:segregation and condensation protein A